MRRIGIDARKLGDGGIGRYVEELLQRLPALAPDDDFVVLARARDLRGARRLPRRVGIVPVRAAGYSLAEHVEIARVARREELDLLHVPHYVLPRGVGCPVVVTVHDLIHWRLPRSRLHALYCRRMLASVRSRAQVVLTPSESVARDLSELAGFSRERVQVVPNGLSAGFDEEVDETFVRAFCRRLGLEGPYVLNVTNGLPHKGLEELLEAVAPIDGLALVLAGFGSSRPAVERRIRDSRIDPERVHVLGGVSERELGLAYRGARVVAVPSRLEGFGLPALEAMAAGAPVVVTDAGGLPEVVGDAGTIVPAESVASLRAALYRIAFEIDPEERESLIRRGRSRARLFSWERTARETLAAYERALAE